MLKDQTASSKQNSFSITRFQTQCYYEAVTLDFSPPFNLNKASNSIVPSFCKDKKFYTPAFILPRQQEYYEKNSLFEKTHFEQRIFKAVSQSKALEQEGRISTQLNAIAPSGLYCQICKESYNSYFDHIREDLHQKLSSTNPANEYIADLCSSYLIKVAQNQIKIKQFKKRKIHKQPIKQKQQSVCSQTRYQKRKKNEEKDQQQRR